MSGIRINNPLRAFYLGKTRDHAFYQWLDESEPREYPASVLDESFNKNAAEAYAQRTGRAIGHMFWSMYWWGVAVKLEQIRRKGEIVGFIELPKRKRRKQ